MDTYDLEKDKSKYKDFKKNVINMYNVLSHSDIGDNLYTANSYLKNDYQVNNSPFDESVLNKQKAKIKDCITKLKLIIDTVSDKIDDINSDIDAANKENN